MTRHYVVDTNVMIAASVADPSNPADINATPDDPKLLLEVWKWLVDFQDSPSHLVLDGEGKILEEYQNKLGFNDFGIQVVQSKWSEARSDVVDVKYDLDGHAVLPDTLAEVVHDLADRKMVAASLASHEDFGEGRIAFAGDTDWHDWEATLRSHEILLEPVIETWSRAKHAEKKERK